MITVGIVSPGAMGAAIGRVLASGGARVVATVAGRSERTQRLAEGLALLPTLDDVVRESAIVLSVVPPGAAVEVARDIAAAAGAHRSPAARRGSERDLARPPWRRRRAPRRPGLHLVDGSISGPPPRVAGSTVIYLSGPRAAQVASLDAPGLDLRVVGDEIGTASAIKMSTASFYKGQTAIFAQALRAARANGVLEFVLDDLAVTTPISSTTRRGCCRASRPSRAATWPRWTRSPSSQEAAGLPPELFAALAKVFAELSRSPAAGRSPEEADAGARLEDVLASLDDAEPASEAAGGRAAGGARRRSP